MNELFPVDQGDEQQQEEITRGYMTIPNMIVFDPKISPLAKFVLGMILSFQFYSQCYASNEYFAMQFQVSVRTIERIMKELEDYKMIERIYDPRTKKRLIKPADLETWRAYTDIRCARKDKQGLEDKRDQPRYNLTTDIKELKKIWQG